MPQAARDCLWVQRLTPLRPPPTCRKRLRGWPDWELEIPPHALGRLAVRAFDEVDLRLMLESSRGRRRDVVEGRWILFTSHEGRPWEVIVEPEDEIERLVVVTAYPVET